MSAFSGLQKELPVPRTAPRGEDPSPATITARVARASLGLPSRVWGTFPAFLLPIHHNLWVKNSSLRDWKIPSPDHTAQQFRRVGTRITGAERTSKGEPSRLQPCEVTKPEIVKDGVDRCALPPGGPAFHGRTLRGLGELTRRR